MNDEARVIGASIWSNTEIRGGEFNPLFSSMSSTVMCCVFALVFLLFIEILMGLKDTNPKLALEGLTAYPCCFNFFFSFVKTMHPLTCGLKAKFS